MTAPAGHNNSLNLRAATKTLFPFSPVHLMVLLIVSFHAIGVNKVRNGRTAHSNRLAQDFLQSA